MKPIIEQALRDATSALAHLSTDDALIGRIETAATAIAATFRAGGRVLTAGNGGSLCEAVHFAEELTGRYRRNRPPLPALAISDPAYLSCVANDYGFDQVFARFVEAHARTGDVFVAFSTSGASPSIVRAAETARALGVRVIAVTGHLDSPLAPLADVEIVTPAGGFPDRVQELHLIVLHILIELIEHVLFEHTAATPATDAPASTG